MDDFRRYREQNNSSSRNELFAGATNNNNQGGYGYGQGGGRYPPPGGYYGQQQQQQRQEGETEEDVEEIKSQIHSVKQESVNSTQRSLRLLQEAQNSGEKTLNKLGEQTQRINYTENKLELAEIHAQRASDNANKLKKVNGSMFGFDFNNPFTKKKREAEQLARIQALQEEQRDSREQMRSGNWESKKNIENALKQANNNNTISSSHYQPGKSTNRSKYQFEADEEDDKLEDQIDKNLDSLAAGLGTLQAMAIATGDEVRRQNQVIDRISDKTSALDNRIVGTTHKLKKIG